MITYEGEKNRYTAFPMGGIGAGMICLEGTGTLSHFSIANKPEIFFEPLVFAALSVKGFGARLLEGRVPDYKIYRAPGAGNGSGNKSYGLPRFKNSRFSAKFPFGKVELNDDNIPVDAEITGWSPFIPNDADNSSLPIAFLEYKITNKTDNELETVFSYNAHNEVLMGHKEDKRYYKSFKGGFSVENEPKSEERSVQRRSFAVFSDNGNVKTNCRWFRGGWWDPLSALWKQIDSCEFSENPPHPYDEESGNGSTLFINLNLPAKQSKTVRLYLAWYCPLTDQKYGNAKSESCCEEGCDCGQYYGPWYGKRFNSVNEIVSYAEKNYDFLKRETQRFTDCFYDTTLPDVIIDAIAANLTIIKSPTVLRQQDGTLWSWEGCGDNWGCCHGSCTHVWNYAYAIPHLFSALERTYRETEFLVDQNVNGHQAFRSNLPVSPPDHSFHAASDGQLGGIMKTYRDWKISGDTSWLKRLWPQIRQSIDYCIKTWDPDRQGILTEPHHNTYDIEFWGPDGMCSSFYLGALKAVSMLCEKIGEDGAQYFELYQKGRKYLETELYNGEYFFQKVMLEGLHADTQLAFKGLSAEAAELVKKEGPKYQYGTGCISDGVIGAWMAEMCGIGEILDPEKVKSHLASIYKYNFKSDLSTHANPQRPSYALNDEGGVLLCTWPRGGKPVLPFVYSDEVWTGIEYQVASHMASMGLVKECVDIVTELRKRYDGSRRNPFNEYECGHWYARAMASYSLLQGITGVFYDAVSKTLHIAPKIEGDFRVFLSTAAGYGTAGIKDGKPFVEAVEGQIDVVKIVREEK